MEPADGKKRVLPVHALIQRQGRAAMKARKLDSINVATVIIEIFE